MVASPGLKHLRSQHAKLDAGKRKVAAARRAGNIPGDLPAPRLSLSEFMRAAWHHAGETDVLVWGPHLEYLCEALERVTSGEIKRLAINLPPGYSKSALVNVFWPAWEWSLGMPSKFIHAACVQDLATRDSLKIVQLLESGWWRSRWPVNKNKNARAKNFFKLSNGGFRRAQSKASRTTGQRGNRLVVDDLNSVMEVYSRANLRRSKDWFWKEFMSRKTSDNDPVVVIGQRLHEDDIFADIRERGGWSIIVLPSEYDPALVTDKRYGPTYDRPDWRTQLGELLHPERFDSSALASALREMGSFDYTAQHRQRPSPMEGGLFKRGDFKVYSIQPELSQFEEIVISLDATFSGDASSDHVAALVLGRQGPRALLLDERVGHYTFTETLVMLRELLDEWPGATILIERAANGYALDDVLRQEIGVVRTVKPEGSKEARAVACTPFVEAGMLWVPSDRAWPWVREFLDELCAFPRARYDDRVDALTQVLLKWYGKNRSSAKRTAPRRVN